MKPVIKWMVLVGLVLVALAVVILVGRRSWEDFAGKTGRPLDEKGREELKKQLAESSKSIFIFDPMTSYRLKPSFQGIRHDSETEVHAANSAGILGEREVDPDPAVKKVLFLGDSVAYGSHVPYPAVFISLMEGPAGKEYQLLNAGCPGWSAHQELVAYQQYFSSLPIDAVAIVFSLNDLLRFEWVWRDGRSFRMSAELIGMGGLIDSWRTTRDLREVRNRFKKDPGLSPLATLNNTCLSAYLPRRWDEFSRRNLPLLEEAAGNKKVVVVAVPARAQLEALNSNAPKDAVLYPQDRLRELSLESGAAFIDLLPAFEEGDGPYDTDLYLAGENGDLHLSLRGHRRIAEYLWPKLEAAITRPGEDTSGENR